MLDHRHLLGDIVWFAQWMTERPAHTQATRRSNLGRNLVQQKHRHRADAVFLQNPCDQSDRLITNPSGGSQQHRRHAFVAQASRNSGRSLLD